MNTIALLIFVIIFLAFLLPKKIELYTDSQILLNICGRDLIFPFYSQIKKQRAVTVINNNNVCGIKNSNDDYTLAALRENEIEYTLKRVCMTLNIKSISSNKKSIVFDDDIFDLFIYKPLYIEFINDSGKKFIPQFVKNNTVQFLDGDIPLDINTKKINIWVYYADKNNNYKQILDVKSLIHNNKITIFDTEYQNLINTNNPVFLFMKNMDELYKKYRIGFTCQFVINMSYVKNNIPFITCKGLFTLVRINNVIKINEHNEIELIKIPNDRAVVFNISISNNIKYFYAYWYKNNNRNYSYSTFRSCNKNNNSPTKLNNINITWGPNTLIELSKFELGI